MLGNIADVLVDFSIRLTAGDDEELLLPGKPSSGRRGEICGRETDWGIDVAGKSMCFGDFSLIYISSGETRWLIILHVM